MPFRHLLYNRQNGAPQRPPMPQPMPNQHDQFFHPTLDTNQYQWSNMHFTTYHAQSTESVMMSNEQAYPSKRQMLSVDTTNCAQGPIYSPSPNYASSSQPQFAGTLDGFYRTGPFNYSELMEADISSISQSSMYSPMTSTSRVDGIMEDDAFSMHSSSRRLSATPDMDVSGDGERRCPLISGQSGKCDPVRCGLNAPCLQFASLSPIDECASSAHVTQSRELQSGVTRVQAPLALSPTDAKRTSQKSRQRRRQTVNNNASEKATAVLEKGKSRSRVNLRNTSKPKSASSGDNEVLTAEQTNKIRARQAHSLVERKYRENLNAKMQLLHQTLQNTEFGPKSSNSTRPSPSGIDEDEEDEEDEEAAEKPTSSSSSKVKKSDVLTEALSYVNAAEVEMRHMTDEIHRLNTRIQILEKLVKCEDCQMMKQMVTLKLKHAA